MTEPRFHLISVTGYSDYGRQPTTSFSILDSDYCWEEVWVEYADLAASARRPTAQRRLEAHRRCVALNAAE